MKNVRFYLDTETTGLDCVHNAIVELALIVEVDGEVVEEHDWFMRPASGKLANKEALAVNDLTIEKIKEFESEGKVYRKVLAIFDKYINKYDSGDKAYVFAYNAGFDLDFINHWFRDNGNVYLFSYTAWPWIDVAVLAAIFAEKQRDKLPNFKLGTVAEALGIEMDESKLHNALYDTHLTRQVYLTLEKEFNV